MKPNAVLLLIAAALAACSSPAPEAGPSAVDLAYASPVLTDEADWLLDVYAPATPTNVPAIVIVGNEGRNKDGFGYQELAQDLAEAGAVVFLPNLALGVGTGDDAFLDEDGAGLRAESEAVACAVRFARARAADYGGPSSRVAVIGHSGGAWSGSLVALAGDELAPAWEAFAAARGAPPQQVTCTVDEALSGTPEVFLGYAGAYNYFDLLASEDPELFEVIDPEIYVGRNLNVVLRLLMVDLPTQPLLPPLDDEFIAALLAAGHDVARIDAEVGNMLQAPARQAIVDLWKETVAVLE